ncbi:MAG: D-alanine--D-alanine ligase [Gammaproteobacteria bacterium]|nr:D-alanine--D-alanine ligase [Gammaproteobacteria bacterium]
MTTRLKKLQCLEPKQFGKVAVLMGGNSAEREISLMTGRAVHQALLERGVDAHAVDSADDLINQLQKGQYRRAWIALHGRGGEDGTIQGLLQFLGIPYTGSGVMGSAICMDKLRTKQLLTGAGLATPAYQVLAGEQDFDRVLRLLGLPLMVKPAAEGSSIGLTRVDRAEDLPQAFENAGNFDCEVLAEQWITGPEYTAAILDNEVLPLIRIGAANAFYDYDAKYFSDDTEYVCPCGLPEEREKEFGALALQAFQAVGAAGWGRVDFMLNAAGQPLLLEVNTIPGMTSHSLVPMAAAELGIDFAELVWRILETSIDAASHPSSEAEAVGAC